MIQKNLGKHLRKIGNCDIVYISRSWGVFQADWTRVKFEIAEYSFNIHRRKTCFILINYMKSQVLIINQKMRLKTPKLLQDAKRHKVIRNFTSKIAERSNTAFFWPNHLKRLQFVLPEIKKKTKNAAHFKNRD